MNALTCIFQVGARHFVERHFVGTTFGRIRLLVDVTFRQVRHSVEKNNQVRHSIELVNSIIFITNHLRNQLTLKAKLACHPARCLLPVEIIDRCGLATGPATVGLLPYLLP